MLGTSHQWKWTVLGKSHLWKWTVLGTSHQWNSLAKLLTFSIPFVRISICFPSNDAIKQSISGLQTYGTRAQIGTPKLSLARGILSQFLYFLSPTTISLLCTYTHIWHRTVSIWITVATKQHRSETFLCKSERCEVLTGYLWLGRWSGGDGANTWHWAESFTVCFCSRRQQQQHNCCRVCCLWHSWRRSLWEMW